MERNRSSGIRRIFTVAFDRLFLVRLGKVNVNDCPAGLGNWPRRGLKQEKHFSENTTKPATSFFYIKKCILLLQIKLQSVFNFLGEKTMSCFYRSIGGSFSVQKKSILYRLPLLKWDVDQISFQNLLNASFKQD